MIDKFLPLVLEMEEEGQVAPILVHEKVTFVYIKHNNLYCILQQLMEFIHFKYYKSGIVASPLCNLNRIGCIYVVGNRSQITTCNLA